MNDKPLKVVPSIKEIISENEKLLTEIDSVIGNIAGNLQAIAPTQYDGLQSNPPGNVGNSDTLHEAMLLQHEVIKNMYQTLDIISNNLRRIIS